MDIKKDVKSKSKSLPSTSKKSLMPKLKDNLSITIIENITGQGYSKIKIDQDLLKKNILKVRYISNNKKEIFILKNKNISKLSITNMMLIMLNKNIKINCNY